MELSIGAILLNNVPAFLLCAVLIFGMLCFRDRTIRICIAYGKVLTAVGVLGIIIAFSQYLTDVTILPGMGELSEAFQIVGYITVTVVGFLPLSALLLKYCNHSLMRIGNHFGLDATGVTAITMTLGSSTPVLAVIKDMAPRSKVIVASFLIYSSYAAHLGFTISVAPEMAFALIASKSASAFAAFILAYLTTKNLESEVSAHE